MATAYSASNSALWVVFNNAMVAVLAASIRTPTITLVVAAGTLGGVAAVDPVAQNSPQGKAQGVARRAPRAGETTRARGGWPVTAGALFKQKKGEERGDRTPIHFRTVADGVGGGRRRLRG